MVVIQLTFPTGKYHATPWGRQVNEGAVEWPPSPWRILRALIAVWHHKFPDVPEEDMKQLIAALSAPPSYRLPVASYGHMRHYMPVANDKKTKIFDTFISLAPTDPIVICWPEVELNKSQRNLLQQLLASMNYFGRAESWVLAELLTEFNGECNAKPMNGHGMQQTHELVQLLAPTSENEHSEWRAKMLENFKAEELRKKQEKEAAKGKPVDKVKLGKSQIEKLEASLPATVFEALHAETSDVRKAGWNRPPASEWVDYVVEMNSRQTTRRISFSQSSDRATVARYAIASAVRPRLTDALWIGERVRQALLSISNCDPVFLGRDKSTDKAMLLKGHCHAHYICESNNDPQGRITHLTIFAVDGFGPAQNDSLNKLRKTWGRDGYDLQYVLLGIGNPTDFGGTDEIKGQSPILARSNVWVSRTPFVPADHLRRKYNPVVESDLKACENNLGRIIRKELGRREWLCEHLYQLEDVQLLSQKEQGTHLGGTFTPWLKFHRQRINGGGTRGTATGFGLKLTFKNDVQGPIILGYGCHFGLGQFTPSN